MPKQLRRCDAISILVRELVSGDVSDEDLESAFDVLGDDWVSNNIEMLRGKSRPGASHRGRVAARAWLEREARRRA